MRVKMAGRQPVNKNKKTAPSNSNSKIENYQIFTKTTARKIIAHEHLKAEKVTEY
jgi:hypothetical protein